MRLWIDDERQCPEGWEWAKTSEEAIFLLRTTPFRIEAVSFDHDLGGDDTSRRVVNWMIENEVWADHVIVHSANPIGVDWLLGTVVRYFPSTTKVHRGRYIKE